MNVILFDEPDLWKSLLPLTFTRPVSEIRIGILKIIEKWQCYNWEVISYLTEEYLQPKFSTVVASDNLLINSRFLPTHHLYSSIYDLGMGEALQVDELIIAYRCGNIELEEIIKSRSFNINKSIEYQGKVSHLQNVLDIFLLNGDQIKEDFNIITKGKSSAAVNDGPTITYNIRNIFIENGAKIRAAVLNAEEGPIYIGKNSEVQEGAVIRGPFSIGEGSIINMGGKMRPNTSIGPFCKVGGEISNSVIIGFSNKAHDGFLGNSVLGEWCNLGADTNTSNLKNNYSEVKIWNYIAEKFLNTGVQFCGTIMGDHSKAGINTMFNTGTVVGVGANIFGGGFPPKFIPSFTWGGASGMEEFEIEKNIEVATQVLKRKNLTLSSADKRILRHIFELTAQYRVKIKK